MKRPVQIAAAAAVAVVLLLALPAAAQNIQNLPRQSPAASVSQRIGVSDVEIQYHRPAVANREVWGGLVPYGAVWRAGANDNTTITFSDPVKVEGEELPAGTYGLHMIPTTEEWTVIFSKNATSWGSFTYDQAEDALRVTVRPEKAPFAEQLAYGFEDVTNHGAVAVLHWEELKVPFEITFDTHALAIAEIRRQLRHLPQYSWQGWTSAAGYLVANDIEHELALEWVERSVSMDRNGQNLGMKFRLLQQLGRTEEAEATLAEALAVSNEGQTNQLGYTLLFAGDVDRAIEVFQKNVGEHPESWNVYDSLGEAYAAKGDPARARELYGKALSMAPEDQHPRIQGVLDGLPAE